jgi:hypothetical protein
VKKFAMKNIFRDIEDNFQTRELVLSFLLTGVFLFLSFVGHTRFSTTEIVDQSGGSHTVHISCYGFPFEMIGLLNPIGYLETYWAYYSGGGLLRILWGGLILNFALYFLLAFAIVYLLEKLRS